MIEKLFIHIPKNGGMTIRRNKVLRPKVILATPDIHISPEYTRGLHRKMKEIGDHQGNEHARWRDITPRVTNNVQAFAFVRNPWDRVVSRYWFAKKVIEIEEDSDHYGETDYADISSFEAFLEERHKWGDQEYMWHRAIRGWYPAFDHVCNRHGEVKCDILRFENYNEDIRAYLNIAFDPQPRNVTAVYNAPYQQMYTNKTRQIVADWYQKDIDYWGFDFDTGATRNYWQP